MTNQTTNYGVLFDHGRHARIGLPEAVFCQGKPREAVLDLLRDRAADPAPVLFTRLAADVFAAAPEDIRACYRYHPLSRTAFTRLLPPKAHGRVALVSAGTADGSVLWEAARTLEYLGINHQVIEDNGVAGLWRITASLPDLAAADAVIVVAGLDAALASVVGGLTPRPIFAVPTSVGYGMARQGHTALAAMLVSCAPGVGVMNIDNGYGAACAAARIINLLNEKETPCPGKP
ncbi:nickel pincer cofactor biosynthesis protein LarB [Desulfovibrio legallii]|uniref:nickel pincer cofactor biosynthesis protein LarB n=1 Tax=Desulfovibrio legallii TaxID=571438 RepID=UPI000E51447E|nr:nickel pincer cofactor biosynthesis protein LarB [Desulfovibrio legallii]RHH24278.1 nickel pincer cofactor biosynthesis protein LarB [Desulfovibrio sp. AM18-2]